MSILSEQQNPVSLPSEPIGGLAALVLITPNLDAQRQFYEHTLGLEVVQDYGEAVILKCGEQILALFAYGHHTEGSKRLGGATHGISHLEFNLPASARAEWDERLKEGGHHAYGENYQDADGNLFHFA